MIVDKAEIVMTWSDGGTVKLGTMQIDAVDNALRYKKNLLFRQKLGWELVRAGFRCMIPSAKWKAEVE